MTKGDLQFVAFLLLLALSLPVVVALQAVKYLYWSMTNGSVDPADR